MDAKGVRNMYSILVVFNKHNTARVASCWFIICYRLVVNSTQTRFMDEGDYISCRGDYVNV